LPDTRPARLPFELAAAGIEAWLNGPGAALVRRSQGTGSRRSAASWEFELPHPTLGAQTARLSLRRDFPATAPEIHFNDRLCLVLPHIEENGRFCHGVESSPGDYDQPTRAVDAVLRALIRFWAQAVDDNWVLQEFHRERLSYWSRFCEHFRVSQQVPAPLTVRVLLSEIECVTEGKLTAYFRRSQAKRCDLMLASPGDIDPHPVAVRHGWSTGALVRGHSLFVPVPENVRWTPADWPRTLSELESFVEQVSPNRHSVLRWIESKQDDEAHPFLVVLVQGKICFGYLVSPAPVPRLTGPGVIPVCLDRIDVAWALSRDHESALIARRQKAKVLILGCGSLGAPVAELLARAGVGDLHLLDKETFEPENCARHTLGFQEIGRSKADAVAARLRQLVPGITVKPFRALATDWVTSVCKPGQYDLVLDCTGEDTVRVMLSRYRDHSTGRCDLVHAWVEPFCAATHVVYIAADENWPDDDPGHKVAAAQWADDTRVNLPACGAGFHPYGAADVWQAAGFTAERVLAVLDKKVDAGTVWSSIRAKPFFETLDVQVVIGPLVPDMPSALDSVQLTRSLRAVLDHG
jgi:molybdopterin/thiamine biosynthesis adenylyltransferase